LSVIFIFLDGVGYGENDPERNPWADVDGDTLIAFKDNPPGIPGSVWRPLDACLGIDGIPQSATGTTSLLTGINASKALGKHLSGFPNNTLLEIIGKHSIHLQAKNRGIKSTFANAYNEAYFRRPPSRQSTTTHAVHAAGIPFRMMDDYRNSRAVFHDLTGELIRAQGNDDSLLIPDSIVKRGARVFHRNKDNFKDLLELSDMPLITPEEGGDRVVRIAANYDLVVFEYVKTDMAGHAQNRAWANSVVDEIMRFLRRIVLKMDKNKDTLIIASDHGNSEDLSVKSHSMNPVPAVAVGRMAEQILDKTKKITDLTPRILNVLGQ